MGKREKCIGQTYVGESVRKKEDVEKIGCSKHRWCVLEGVFVRGSCLRVNLGEKRVLESRREELCFRGVFSAFFLNIRIAFVSVLNLVVLNLSFKRNMM